MKEKYTEGVETAQHYSFTLVPSLCQHLPLFDELSRHTLNFIHDSTLTHIAGYAVAIPRGSSVLEQNASFCAKWHKCSFTYIFL